MLNSPDSSTGHVKVALLAGGGVLEVNNLPVIFVILFVSGD